MSTDYTNLLVLDCSTTLWEKQSEQPAGQDTEVIRIDIALVDTAKNQIAEQEIIYVKPKKSKISNFCERMFHVKQSKIDADGIPFAEVYRKLRIYYMSRDKMLAGWGLSEKYIMDRQCKISELENLFTQSYHNLQQLYTLMTGSSEEPHISDALKYCEIAEVENRAVNAANIYMRMAKGLRPPVTKARIIVPEQYRRMN